MIVLSLLAEGPAHGYGLVRSLDARTEGAFTLKEGTLYPTLHELEAEGLLKAEWERSPEGRKRRLYTLTQKGKKKAIREVEAWAEVARVMQAVLAAPA